jgi:hypothetical protein
VIAEYCRFGRVSFSASSATHRICIGRDDDLGIGLGVVFGLARYAQVGTEEEIEFAGPTVRVLVLGQLLQQAEERVLFGRRTGITRGCGVGAASLGLAAGGLRGDGGGGGEADVCCWVGLLICRVEGERGVLRVGGRRRAHVEKSLGQEAERGGPR